MDKSTEKLIKKIAPDTLPIIKETRAAIDARAIEYRDRLRERYPDYESLLAAAATYISLSRDLELMIRATINSPDLSIEDKLAFINAIHPDKATDLKNTLKTKAAANGSSGGKKRSAKHQALRSEIINAYLIDPKAQAAKQIEHAKNILIKHNPELADRMGHRTIRDAISDYRKNIL